MLRGDLALAAITTNQLIIRVAPELLERLDEWRREQADLPSRPEAARRILDKTLADDAKAPKRLTTRRT